eukprot:NODE_7_length_67686_cov_1.621421.p18 type:complete len:310 gc:universal NODE_7_length_67686_cov_1.621421:20230-21159(+)
MTKIVLPDLIVVNAINIEELKDDIIKCIKNSSFVCVNLVHSDKSNFAPKDNEAAEYAQMKRILHQSTVVSIALSVGTLQETEEGSSVTRVKHFQIQVNAFTDSTDHNLFTTSYTMQGYNVKEAPFAIRYFPGKPRDLGFSLGTSERSFIYPKAHTSLMMIMNSILLPSTTRYLFVYEGLETLMGFYNAFITCLPHNSKEFLVDCEDIFKNVIDVSLYSKLLPLRVDFPIVDKDLFILALEHGDLSKIYSVSAEVPTQSWPEFTDVYEQQIIESKNKPLEVGEPTQNYCTKTLECGYCEKEGYIYLSRIV